MRRGILLVMLGGCVVLAGCAQVESVPLREELKVRADALIPMADRSASTINIWVHKLDPKSADVVDRKLVKSGFTWYGKIVIETGGEKRYLQYYKWDADSSLWRATEQDIVRERIQAVFSGLQPDDSVRPRPDEIFGTLEAAR